jgi:MFS family permease
MPPRSPFACYAAAILLLTSAQEIIVVAVGWLVFQRTGSVFDLGLIGLSGFLPSILLSLVTGTVADRVDRRTILVACTLVLAVGTLGLCAAAAERTVWPIYLVVVLLGVAKAFLQPVTKAVLPALVPAARLTRALALTNSLFQCARLFAPALGGFLFAFSVFAPFVVAAVLFAASAALLAGIGRHPPLGSLNRPTWTTVVAGYRFIWGKPIVLGAMSLDLVAVLLGGATALLPAYVQQVFHAGPWALGVLRTAPAVGALATGAFLSRQPLRRRVGRTLLVTVAIYGFATVGFGLSSRLPVALGFLVLLGAADTVSMIIRQSLVQLQTPDSMRGRVSAVHSVVTGASNELGEFESGMLAAMVGAVPAVVLGGLGAIAAALLWAVLFPPLRDADRLEEMPAARAGAESGGTGRAAQGLR